MAGKVRKFKTVFGDTEHEARMAAAEFRGWQQIEAKRIIGGMWVVTMFRWVSMREAYPCLS